MKEKFKSVLSLILGKNFSNYLLKKAKNFRNLYYLFSNTFVDFKLYYKYSTIFKVDDLKKEEALLILDYHSIEKGMLFIDMKSRFAKNRVERIHKQLKSVNLLNHLDRSQIKVTIQIMC